MTIIEFTLDWLFSQFGQLARAVWWFNGFVRRRTRRERRCRAGEAKVTTHVHTWRGRRGALGRRVEARVGIGIYRGSRLTSHVEGSLRGFARCNQLGQNERFEFVHDADVDNRGVT
jgi:hypothetical protein